MTTKYNYTEVITKSLLFYYAQRSGHLPANDNPIPYRFDSALGDVGQNGEDLTGGYYDGNISLLVYFYEISNFKWRTFFLILAGDFVKFGFPMASMTTVAAWSVIDYSVGYSSAGMYFYFIKIRFQSYILKIVSYWRIKNKSDLFDYLY